METSTRFSNTELVLLISNCVMSKLFLVYPTSFATLGASASIILALVTALLGLIFITTASILFKTKKDITDMIPSKFFKVIYSIVVILLFTVNQGLFVRSVAESLKISILPDSPLVFITLIFMSGVLICSHTGLKSIVRAHSFVTPFTLAVTVALMISSVNNFDIYNLFPIFGNGSKMLVYLILLASYFADFLLLFFVIPFSSEKTTFNKIAFPSYAITSAMLVAIISIYTLVIPYSASDTFFIPVYRIAQYINYKSFMARMESIFTIGWMLSYFLTSATYLYVTSMITGRLFNAKSYRPFMYIVATAVFLISLIPKNTTTLVEYSNYLPIPRIAACMVIPIVILYLFKKREGRKT